MKIRIEYTVDLPSKGERQVLANYARELGLDHDKVKDVTLLKRLFQKKGEDVREQPS
jgi:hypothetical protein